jgi:hypothetical protein
MRASAKGVDLTSLLETMQQVLVNPDASRENTRQLIADVVQVKSDINNLQYNPVYVGIPPYPPVVSEPLWVTLQEHLIERDGVTQYLVNLLHMLRMTYAKHFRASDLRQARRDSMELRKSAAAALQDTNR